MILVKDIIQEGHPTLAKKAEMVNIPLDKQTIKTLKEMMQYLEYSQDDELCAKYDLRPGVGLAAPQINVSKQMFVMMTYNETGDKFYKLALVNPQIIATSEEKTYLPGGEGCLSVSPEKNGTVIRYNKIKFKGYNYNFEKDILEPIQMTLKGYPAIVFQHEYDHLNGVLFISKKTNNLNGIKPVFFPDEE